MQVVIQNLFYEIFSKYKGNISHCKLHKLHACLLSSWCYRKATDVLLKGLPHFMQMILNRYYEFQIYNIGLL